MGEKRIGRQTPTQSVVLPYSQTAGLEAVDLYNRSERKAMEWQSILICDIMAINDDDLWVHTKFGYSVPRRNGKSEMLFMRELWALRHGEQVLHTAHRTATSHSAWERICVSLATSGLKEGVDYKTYKQLGFESIEMINGDGGRINFRTRSSKGGLGEGYDLLIIDEAQEYEEDQEAALKYVVSDSANPQIIMCGTPPTPTSSGTVFAKLRNATFKGQSPDTGWAEWSVPVKSDVHNVDLWYECNPSMGTILTERKVNAEIGTDDIDFNIQRLGLWIQHNQKSAISKVEWEALRIGKLPQFNKSVYAGIKCGVDGSNIVLSVAVRTVDGKIFVETIDCQPTRNGTDWIMRYLKVLKPQKVVVDGAGQQNLIADSMKDAHIKGCALPTVKEVITANSAFEQAVFSKLICHSNQPALMQAASNCEKRAIGSNGGFGYRSLNDAIEIALLDSVILAFWACNESKVRRKQRIGY